MRGLQIGNFLEIFGPVGVQKLLKLNFANTFILSLSKTNKNQFDIFSILEQIKYGTSKCEFESLGLLSTFFYLMIMMLENVNQ